MKEESKMKKSFVALFAACVLLAGCGQSEENTNGSNEELPELIEAVLDVPEKGDPGTEITLAVKVVQGDSPVEDANEVEFEIWKDGNKEESEMLEGNHTENGEYSSVYSFPEDGLYYVQSHVTARGMHTMPKKPIEIGNLEAEQHEHQGEATEEGHHHGDVSIHLEKADTIQANEQTALSVLIKKGEEPLSEAKVRLEITQEGSNPTWVDMKEDAAGEYKNEHQFTASGNYTVTIHVQNDEGLHEHTEVEVKVK